jgi:hypothetical protein
MAARAAIGLDSKTLPQLRKKEQSLPQIVDHTPFLRGASLRLRSM